MTGTVWSKRLLMFGLLALPLLAGCPSRSNPEPVPATAAQVKTYVALNATSSAERIEAGRQLVITNCRRCHGYPKPDEVAHDDWPAIAKKMCKRTKIPESDHDLVVEYLVSVSR